MPDPLCELDEEEQVSGCDDHGAAGHVALAVNEGGDQAQRGEGPGSVDMVEVIYFNIHFSTGNRNGDYLQILALEIININSNLDLEQSGI